MSSISSSGLTSPPVTNLFSNSGMDISGIISKLIAAESVPITNMQRQEQSIKTQQSVYTQIQNETQTLLNSIKTLTSRDIITGASIFDNMKATSSNSAIATATTSGPVAAQTINLQVNTLPTSSTATSTTGVGALMTGSTTLSQLGITTNGNFTVFSNGTAYSISAASTDSVSAVLGRITSAVPGVTSANVVNGAIQLQYSAGTQISLGAGGDTSNFLAQTNLSTAVNNAGASTITASNPVTTIDQSQLLSSAAANLATPVTDGTFTINGVSFDTTGKSLSDMITAINGSTAGVTASYNQTTNKLQIISKQTGSALINLANGTGNFLTAMGLTGAGAQTAGTNAQFVLNGTTMYSTSTTVGPSVTGLNGITLNLASAQPGTTIQITTQQDTASIVNAVQTVVNNYNTVIKDIDNQTNAQNKAPLAGDTQLISLRNQIRSLFSTGIGGLSGTAYDSLQQVGITSPTFVAGSTASPTLSLDTSKLTAALNADPVHVKKLFIAQALGGALKGTSADDGFDGVFTQIQHLLSDTTYVDSNGNTQYGALYNGGTGTQGLFAAYQTSTNSRIQTLDKSIQSAQDRLAQKQQQLQQQFNHMDQLIGQYQQQGNAVNGLISQLNANSGK